MRTETKPPYSSERWSSEFSDYAAELRGGVISDRPAIRAISVIGALFDKNYNMYGGDVETILRSVMLLEDSNISLSQNTDFHFYNLLAPINSDFLRAAILDKNAPASDAVIVCGAYGRFHPEIVLDNMPYYQRDIPYDTVEYIYNDIKLGLAYNREVGISRLQADPCAWPEAADAIGAKIVITRGGSQDEISTKTFLQSEFYRAAIGTDEKHEMVYCTVSGSLGVAIHENAVAELQERAKPNNLLGQRILSLPVVVPT